MNVFKSFRLLTRDLEELDKRLQAQEASPQGPPWLHASIMNAIKIARPAERRNYLPAAVPRLALAGCLIMIGFGIWFAVNRPASRVTVSLPMAADALDFGNEINGTVPRIQVPALSEELERLDHDLDNAAQTLLAALP